VDLLLSRLSQLGQIIPVLVPVIVDHSVMQQEHLLQVICGPVFIETVSVIDVLKNQPIAEVIIAILAVVLMVGIPADAIQILAVIDVWIE
jgi:hypothetical protein